MQATDNKQLSDTIRQIRRLIAASMDGVTAEKMRASGLTYHQNFGVALPRLHEIAEQFTPNTDIAQALWTIDGRETKIVSLLLTPSQTITLEAAFKLSEQCSTNELVEIATKELFSKMDCAELFIDKLLKDPNNHHLLVACCTAAHCYKSLSNETTLRIATAVSQADATLSVYNMALTLFTHIADNDTQIIQQIIATLRQSTNETCLRMANWLA